MPYSQAEGIFAEAQAVNYLEESGLTIVARNVNYPGIGELDIVCKEKDVLVIVEVKYRSNDEFGHPIESITKSKIKKILKSTEKFISEYPDNYSEIRFDVVTVLDGIIEHIRNAFDGYFM